MTRQSTCDVASYRNLNLI